MSVHRTEKIIICTMQSCAKLWNTEGKYMLDPCEEREEINLHFVFIQKASSC